MPSAMRRTCLCLYVSGAVLFHGLSALAGGLVSSKAAQAAATSQKAHPCLEARTKARGSSRKAAAPCRQRTAKQSALRLPAVNARLAGRHGRPQVDAANTWLIFGFAEGSDVGNKGEWAFFQDSILRAARQGSRLAAWESTTGVGYSLSNRAVIGVAATSLFERDAAPSNPSGGIGSSQTRNVGALASFKYQVFRRDEAPVGLAVQISPYL